MADDLAPIDTSYADSMYNYGDTAPSYVVDTTPQTYAGFDSSNGQGTTNTSAPSDINAAPGYNFDSLTPTSDVSSIGTGGSTALGGSSSGSGALSSGLSSLLKALGLGGGNTSNSSALGTLAQLLGQYGQYSNNKKNSPSFGPPPLFGGQAGFLPGAPGASTGFGPAGGYGYQNYQHPASSAGLGYAPRTQAGAVQPQVHNAQAYYTYGQGAQPAAPTMSNGNMGLGLNGPVKMAAGGSVPGYSFGGMIPMITPSTAPQGRSMSGAPGAEPATQPATQNYGALSRSRFGGAPGRFASMADGGKVSRVQKYPDQMSYALTVGTAPEKPWTPHTVPPVTPPAKASGGALSRHIKGPGDGTSDDIPARLATGEYVIDAQGVSMLGNGDNHAGAKKLDAFRKNLRIHKGGALSKGKMAPDAKSVEQYMGGKVK